MSRIDQIKAGIVTIKTINEEKVARINAIKNAVKTNKRDIFGTGSSWSNKNG